MRRLGSLPKSQNIWMKEVLAGTTMEMRANGGIAYCSEVVEKDLLFRAYQRTRDMLWYRQEFCTRHGTLSAA